MTTVAEFKKKLETLPDSAPLEFWAILEKGLVELTLSPSEGVRFPAGQVAEIVLTPATDTGRKWGKPSLQQKNTIHHPGSQNCKLGL